MSGRSCAMFSLGLLGGAWGMEGLNGSYPYSLDEITAIHPGLSSSESAQSVFSTPAMLNANMASAESISTIPTSTVSHRGDEDIMIYMTLPAESMEACLNTKFRKSKFAAPPEYGELAKCLSPDINTLVDDLALAKCCEGMHIAYTYSSTQHYSAQKHCFTTWDLGDPIVTATPTSYVESIYSYDGGFTTLCDGIPRATKSVSPILVTHTGKVDITTTPNVATIYADGEHTISKYPYPRPSCTVAPRACVNLWEEFEKGSVGFGLENIGQLEYSASRLSPKASTETGIENSPDFQASPNCRNIGSKCPKHRVLSCPNTGGYNEQVDLIDWEPQSYALCSNTTNMEAVEVPDRTTVWSGYTMIWPTKYVMFHTMTETGRFDIESSVEGLPRPTYTSVILPAKEIALILDTDGLKYDLALIGTSTDPLVQTASVPMAPWPLYSALKGISQRREADLRGDGLERPTTIPKTIYHDVNRMPVAIKLAGRDLKAIDPCWDFCDTYVLAPDPPIVLSSVTGASELKPVALPTYLSNFPVETAVQPPEYGTGHNRGGPQDNPPSPRQQSDVEPVSGVEPGERGPVETGQVGFGTGAGFGTGTGPGFGTGPGAGIGPGFGTGIGPGFGTGPGPGIGGSPPLEAALTPSNAQAAFTASTVNDQEPTMVAGGSSGVEKKKNSGYSLIPAGVSLSLLVMLMALL